MCNFLLYSNTIKRSRHFIDTSHMVASKSSIKKIELPTLINDILYFVKFFESVLFSFVSREGNSLAHLVVQWAAFINWSGLIPISNLSTSDIQIIIRNRAKPESFCFSPVRVEQ